MKSEGSQGPVRFDARLAEGVAYFEQMLEIMPEDRTTLEFLVVAYEQLGQHEKSENTLLALTKLLIKEQDLEALQGLTPRLEASSSAAVQAMVLKVRTLTAPMPDLTPEAPKELTESEKTALCLQGAIKSELALADVLHKAGVLDDEAYRMVLEHLESTPMDGRVFLTSAVQVLEKENMTLSERAVEHLADACGTPPIPLASFDVNPSLVKAYPELMVRVRGVIPFAKLGTFTLVAVLNPLDEALKAEIAAVAPCRFYLADPAAVEQAIAKVYGSTV